MTTNDERFLADFRSMSTFGATPAGGVHREAASNADGQTRNWFRGLMEGHGFRVSADAVGNQFALFEFEPGLPTVMLGSHLDSQPFGGRFDGAYGVLCGAHAAIRLVESWREGRVHPTHNVVVTNWFNEEGSRFIPSMMGSSVYTGKLELETALATTDPRGVSVKDALDAIGTRNDDFEMPRPASYIEIHIEQGRTLENAGVTIGLVESTWGAQKYELIIRGAQGHTGATRIADRHDALLGASLLVVAARDIADEFEAAGHDIVTSCGKLDVHPNSPVVIASEVRMMLDLRSSDPEVLRQAVAKFEERLEEAAERARVEIVKQQSHDWAAQSYPAQGVELARACAEELGLSAMETRTLAGHDSTNMKDLVPTVMLFVPSVEGISHAEAEYTKDEDLVAGLTLVTRLLEKVAEGALAA